MENLLYLECASGIAGDMTVAALLDLGASEDGLFRTLGELALSGYDADVEEYMNGSILTRRFTVTLEDPSHPDAPDALNFDPRYEFTDHEHLHSHSHSHEHEHSHEHGHTHAHRNLEDVTVILNRLSDPSVRDLALRIFRIIAEAEASVHGISIDEVHFHEVGAVDSIVDITAAAFCLHDLGIREILLSSIAEGSGTILCAHGELPVPVPAVLSIASKYGLPLRHTELEGERITPTGAAIAAALWKGRSLPEQYTVLRTGYASGHRVYPSVSILRAMLIKGAETGFIPGSAFEPMPEHLSGDALYKLETNIDDCTGEALGMVLGLLMDEGAKDAFYTPIYMKKNRPAYMLSVLCSGDRITDLERIIFRHTTTIGIRRCRIERDCLERRIVAVETPYGYADVKVCTFEENSWVYPEFDSIAQLCASSDLSFQEASALIVKCYEERIPL